MKNYYLNGHHTKVSLYDNRAFHYGECIITTCRVEHGEIKHYKDHLRRLAHGVSERFFYNSLSEQEFIWLKKTIGNQMMAIAGQLASYSLRVNCFFLGKGRLKVTNRKLEDLQILIETSPLIAHSGSLNNVSVHKGDYRVASRVTSFKTSQYFETSYWMNHPKYKNCDELLFSDGQNILCLGVYNFFALRDNEIITPPISNHVLDGVVRRKIIELAESLNIKVSVRDVLISELSSFDMTFGTNCLKGLVAIRKIEKKEFATSSDNFNILVEAYEKTE